MTNRDSALQSPELGAPLRNFNHMYKTSRGLQQRMTSTVYLLVVQKCTRHKMFECFTFKTLVKAIIGIVVTCNTRRGNHCNHSTLAHTRKGNHCNHSTLATLEGQSLQSLNTCNTRKAIIESLVFFNTRKGQSLQSLTLAVLVEHNHCNH